MKSAGSVDEKGGSDTGPKHSVKLDDRLHQVHDRSRDEKKYSLAQWVQPAGKVICTVHATIAPSRTRTGRSGSQWRLRGSWQAGTAAWGIRASRQERLCHSAAVLEPVMQPTQGGDGAINWLQLECLLSASANTRKPGEAGDLQHQPLRRGGCIAASRSSHRAGIQARRLRIACLPAPSHARQHQRTPTCRTALPSNHDELTDPSAAA